MKIRLLPSSASFRTSFWISVLVPISIPRVGSSRIRKSGFVASHLARITFCWFPPESCLIRVSRLAHLIWRRSIYLSAISHCFAIGIFFKMPCFACTARMIFSLTERSAIMPSALRSSGRSPIPRCIASIGFFTFTSWPFTFRVPVCARSAP